jgi:hypothetical protein
MMISKWIDSLFVSIAPREWRIGLFAGVMLIAMTQVAGTEVSRVHAQDYAGSVYTSFHSMQTFERDGESIRAARIAIYLTLSSWETRPMGLRLRLASTFAASDLFDLFDRRLEEVSVLSFVPGIEFVFPVGRNHMLRPFLDAGIGSDNVSKNVHFLGALGLRTELIFPHGRFIFGLEPGFRLGVNSGPEVRDNTVFNPFLTLSVRRVLGFHLSGYPADAGLYFEGGYDFASFELTQVSAASNDVRNNFEVGVGIGFSQGRPRIGPFRLPRIRVGYRFGDIEGFRIRIGGDWLTTVAAQKKAETHD